MSVQGAPSDGRSLSIQTISGVVGALVGVITTIFGAGIYYQNLTSKIDGYVAKIDANEKAIKSLQDQLEPIATFKKDLVRGHVDPAAPDNLTCPQGSFVQAIGALSESGLEHGAIYAVSVVCRKFGTAP